MGEVHTNFDRLLSTWVSFYLRISANCNSPAVAKSRVIFMYIFPYLHGWKTYMVYIFGTPRKRIAQIQNGKHDQHELLFKILWELRRQRVVAVIAETPVGHTISGTHVPLPIRRCFQTFLRGPAKNSWGQQGLWSLELISLWHKFINHLEAPTLLTGQHYQQKTMFSRNVVIVIKQCRSSLDAWKLHGPWPHVVFFEDALSKTKNWKKNRHSWPSSHMNAMKQQKKL